MNYDNQYYCEIAQAIQELSEELSDEQLEIILRYATLKDITFDEAFNEILQLGLEEYNKNY